MYLPTPSSPDTLMSTASESFTGPFVDKGLANVVVADSVMSFIDGEKGVLEYVGIDIDSLARNSTFEECCFLLWNQRLPNADELAAFTKELQAAMTIPDGLMDMLKALPADTSPMHALRTLVSAQAHFDASVTMVRPRPTCEKAAFDRTDAFLDRQLRSASQRLELIALRSLQDGRGQLLEHPQRRSRRRKPWSGPLTSA